MVKLIVYAAVAFVAYLLLRQFHAGDWLAGLVILLLLGRWWIARRIPGLRRHLYRKKKET